MTPELRELHEMVTQVKCDKEVGLAYMKAYELEQKLLRQGRKEGRKKGREEGTVDTLADLVSDGLLTFDQAAERSGLPKADFAARMKGQTAGADDLP